jgi:hypothetical protein
MKSRKLRNRKMRGGNGRGMFCNHFITVGCDTDEKNKITNEINSAKQGQPQQSQFQGSPVGVNGEGQGQGQGQLQQREEQGPMRRPELKGGKSNHRRNKKSKKSRRTKRRQ